jgi:hypothetical protein
LQAITGHVADRARDAALGIDPGHASW